MKNPGAGSLDNPFSVRRWEFETDHVVWVPAKAKKVLGQSPCHIQGVRGSGKTALLRLSDYYTRKSSRMHVFNPSNTVDRCLGVYVNFLDEFTEYFDLYDQSEYYYNYTILYCYAKVFDLLDDANRDGVLTIKLATETEIVKKITLRFDIKPSKYETIDSFVSLASFLRRHCRKLRDAALSGSSETPEIILMISGIEFADWVCSKLRETDVLTSDGANYFIKISVDDAHLASPDSQKRINNILYRSQAPIFWNIAYVEGQFDPFAIDNRMKYVTAHDREFVDLNYRDEPREFSFICEKIFEIRVTKELASVATEQPSDGPVDLKSYIGRLSFEEMFERMLAKSKKRSVLDSLNEYKEAIAGAMDRPNKVKSYQAFLASCIFPSISELRNFLDQRTSEQIDNYFRQKGAAALAVGARRLELSVPYEGFNTLMYLADGCLRDFLSLCSELFELDQERPPAKRAFFHGDHLPTELQTRAFTSYAKKYSAGLHDPRQPYSRELSKLIRGLGHLTYLLQTEDYRIASLLPDRGIFRIDFEPSQRSLFLEEDRAYERLVREILKEAVYTGAARIEDGSIGISTTIDLRLAGVLSPELQLAPRKPFRISSISYLQLRDLISPQSGMEAEDWSYRVYNQLSENIPSEIAHETLNPRML
ncbi:hypothetical protein [Shinella sp. WSJ-2]|uniref:ORC-CDC6 family AAA ATPase n=1 Tax=Shinella sp. WSJ-2 TaxID=2303749 RepID=UPI0011C19A66|nr:hypothetical protein [Shinella sp. WSJ-2]